MAFQWLQMRVQEERERRDRLAKNLERLPGALSELHTYLAECIQEYTANFGANSAEIALRGDRIEVVTREQRGGKWQELSRVEVITDLELPGFVIQLGDNSTAVEVGLLPSDKVFYRDREQDKYLTTEEFTRRILDRALFPALREQ